MSVLTLASIVLALVGVLMCLLGVRRLFRRQPFSAIKLELGGLLVLLLAALMFVLASNIYMYQRLVYEAPIAEIEFNQLGPQQFTATLLRGETQQQYVMQGDEWQLDAQMLLWHGFATVIGLDAQYRLHRLSGRYIEIADEQEKVRSVYALSDAADVDLWSLANQNRTLIEWLVDASYGSAVYLPMTDKARYQISIGRSGLVARPTNLAAKQAVSRWIGL